MSEDLLKDSVFLSLLLFHLACHLFFLTVIFKVMANKMDLPNAQSIGMLRFVLNLDSLFIDTYHHLCSQTKGSTTNFITPLMILLTICTVLMTQILTLAFR
jgi:hypothetical protein